MKHQRLAGTSHDSHPSPAALDPALRQAFMRVNPDYFGWSLEAQERYRVSMPEQDAFRLRQTLLKTLFGLHAQTEEDLEKITDQFSNEEHLVFNRAWLPAAGVGEDSFFLNEYLDEGKTLLDFDTLYEYDYDDHNFQEQARKDEMLEYVVKPYRGALYYRWARLFIDGVFYYASLCMAAGYVYNCLDESGQEKVSTLIPHRYVNAKDHGKREGKGTIFSQRLEAGGKEGQAEELQRRFWDYLSQRYDALQSEFDGQARKAVYMEDKSRPHDPHMNFIFSDKTALQAVRFRYFMRDCRPLVADRRELDAVITRDKSVRIEEPLARIIAGEGNFEGELPRFGHGLQRSYLLALLHELASSDDTATPRLILGCEEPELYQHPPQARHLATVLQDLSKANSQVIISTHSPLFVSGEGFEDVRMVRKDAIAKRSTVTYMAYKDIADAVAAATGELPTKPQGVLAKIHQALQPSLNEMFFTSRLVLVEGLEDVAYLSSYLHLLNTWEQYRRSGCHIVPVNGKSEMLRPVVIAKRIGTPTFVVFDSDADEQDPGKRAKHEKDNKALLALLGKANENPLPTTSVWGPGFVMWRSNIGSLVRAEIGAADWSAFQAEADKQYGHAGGLRKNTLHIGFCLTRAWESGKRSPSLERLCNEILNPAASVQ